MAPDNSSADPNNSASRLLAIVLKGLTLSDTESCAAAWATIFAVSDLADPERMYELARLLGLVHKELVSVRQTMQANERFTREEWEWPLQRVEQGLQVAHLPHSWNTAKQFFGPEVVRSLRFLSRILPDESSAVRDDEVATLIDELNALERSVREGNLPADLKLFLFGQIDILRRAVREYRIRGTRAFREAAYECVIHWKENEEVVDAKANAEHVQWWHRIWEQVVTWGNRAEKAEKVISAGTKLLQAGTDLADQLDKLS